MRRVASRLTPFGMILGLLGPGLTLPARAQTAEAKKFEKTYSFVGDKETKVGVSVDNVVTIESFVIKDWPDPNDFAKAEKDVARRHTMKIEFRYTNRDTKDSYKCRYTVTVTGDKETPPLGQDADTKTLTHGRALDTNILHVKMRTADYKVAKNIKIVFEIWRK